MYQGLSLPFVCSSRQCGFPEYFRMVVSLVCCTIARLRLSTVLDLNSPVKLVFDRMNGSSTLFTFLITIKLSSPLFVFLTISGLWVSKLLPLDTRTWGLTNQELFSVKFGAGLD